MIHLALWGAITLCCIVWCCCGLISCSSSPQFQAAYLSEPVNKIIINQRCKGKRFVSVKYDTRWGGVSWQVAIFEPLIWSLCGSGNSQHSSRTITSRCKDLIQQILGGSFQLAPGPPSPLTPPQPPPPPPPPTLRCVVSLLGRLRTDALEEGKKKGKYHGPHMWLRTLTKSWSTSRKLESHEPCCILQ